MRKALLASAVVIGLSGCGSTTSNGTQEFNTANQLAGTQQYEEAISYLNQAIAKNPKNKTFTAKLAELRTQYLQSSKAKISELLSGDSSQNNIDQAQQILVSLEKSKIASNELNTLKQQVSMSSDALNLRVVSLYKDAQYQMQQSNWVKAHGLLSQISQLSSNYEDVKTRLTTVETQASNSFLKQANDAIAQENFGSAKAYLQDLLKIAPNHAVANNLLQTVVKNDNAEYFLNKAQSAFDRQEWGTVISKCQRLTEYQQPNQNCSDMLVEAKTKESEQLSSNLIDTMSEGRFIEAVNIYKKLQSHNVTKDNRLDQLRDSLSQQAFFSAGTYKQAGNYAVAWHLLKAIGSINANYPELFNEIKQVEDSIFTRAKRKIAIFDFTSPVDSSDSGVIITQNLISHMFNNASNDISIMERANLKTIVEEMKLGQMGVISESSAKEMGRVHGIDYAIMGSVLLYKVDGKTESSTKTVRYQVGEKIEDNIDYLNWKAVNPQPTPAELKAAPKAKIMVPEYGVREYNVTDTKKVGFLQLTFRVVDAQTGENTLVDTIERKLEESDIANAGVSDAGIEFDPMEISTDTEILQSLTEKIVAHMGAAVLQPLENLEVSMFNDGKESERRMQYEAAVESYTYSMFNEKVKGISSSPTSIEAQKRIDNILARYRFNVN
ncbi:CsgG/HfaB family protein [uncultured Paraglaciecola sp.]|uniref:CsgG/HfaB family protein n=1 Tax=uncultured Paraglaciecola sp. TaxID=1765024 RepID=UPI0030D9A7F8|tara:strand:+ start:86086 stop:88080 length:1995 start_codon:yes stop_codon:yes gene_type:complete